jgi:RHS repeat-associated protein
MMRRSSSRAAAPAGRLLSMVLAVVVTAGVVTAVPPVASAAAAVGSIPQQHSGSAAGRDHEVPASSTTSTSADGEHTAPPAPGGLPSDGLAPAPGLQDPVVGRTSVQVGEPSPVTTVGFDENTSREVPEKRAADRQVFDNADGTQTLRKYQGREFYQRPDGVWDRIDSSLVADGTTWRSRAESSVKRFASAANAGEIASVQLEAGKSVGFALSGASGATAQVVGDEVTYREARPAADLQVQATPAGTKETIWLKSVDAPTTWDFPLHFNGVTAAIVDGAVLLKDAGGAVQGTIPPGFMEDSKVDPRSGEGARSHGVTYTLVGDSANPILRVAADQAWLADPARVFPVKVDPSVVGKNTNGTTYVQSPYTADNSGDPNLSVGTFNGGGNKSAAYLKFDSVSSELAGQYVLGAKLWMYETYSYSCQAKPVSVYPVTQGWSVGGTKTYPGPNFGAEVASASFAHGYDGSCGSQWTGIDLGNNGRNLVHGWTHGAANNGLTVRASETDTFGWKKFASAASGNPPYLEVTYTPYWATYGVGAMSPVVTAGTNGTMAVTVTNQGRDPWTPTNNYKLGYRLWDSSGNELPNTYTAWTSMPQTVAPGQSATVNATVKNVPPGSYTLRWDMDDYGYGRFSWDNVPMSAPVTFTIQNQVPAIDAASPPSNFNATTLTPTLALTAHDQDNWPGQGLTYSFKICDSAGANCTQSGVIDSPVWSVPAGTLRWSQNYVWYGQVGDKNGSSPWTLGAYLSTRVPQPAITSHLSSVAGGGVDPGVGNYTTPVTDASVVAVGPALSVVRTYNTLDPRRDAAFGSGWSSRWDSHLAPDTDGSGNVVITSPNGQQARYGRNPDGSYAAPSGQSSTLLAVTGGGWTLRTADGTRFAFDAAGRITTITDGSGRAQNLVYNTAGKLSTATDVVSGRSLMFTWTGNHVTQVTTSSTVTLTWTYTYTGDQLTTVCDPTGACTGYAYTSGSHYRTTTLDANPRAYWRLAESAGTTAVSEVPGFFGAADGTATDLTYGQAGPLAGSPTTAAGFNGTSSVVRMPDDLVRNSAYIGVEMWFKTTSTAGGALFSTGHELPGAATPSGSMPVLYVGTDGKLYGHLWNEQVTGMVSANPVNNGTWHHVALSGALNTQTLYLDGVAVGTQAGTLSNLDTHNVVGAGAFNDHDWTAKPAGTWNYFAGSIAEVSLYHQPLGATVVAEHYAARSAVDELTTVTRPGGAIAASVAYNGAADRVSQYTDANGGTTTVGVPTVEGDGFRYASGVGESNPDAYWWMGETTGTTADGQPQLARGTYVRGTGGKTTGPFGTGSSGQSFDGTASYVRLPDNEMLGNTHASVELWFNTRATTGGVLFATGQGLPGAASPGGSMPVLYVGTDGKLHGHFWNDTLDGIVTTGTVNDGAWHHVVLTGNYTTQSLYLDGVTVGTQAGTIQNFDLYNFVGAGAVSTRQWPARPTNDWGYFTGTLSQVALYAYPLTVADVQAHYGARGNRSAYLTAAHTTEPHALWGLEDENSSAYAANDPGVATGSYSNVTLAAAPAMRGGAAASFNGSTSYAKLANRQVHGRTQLAVELWFQTSAAGGGVLYATGNDLPGTSPPTGGAMPVLYVGTDGKLYGHFWNGSIGGIVTPNAVNDGAWHHVVLAGAGTAQSLLLDGNLVGSQDGQIGNLDRYDFVGAGLSNSNAWPAAPTDAWGHFSGSIGEVAIYHRPLDTASIAAHYAAKTAATAVRTTDPTGGVTTTTYDPTRGGRLISTTTPSGGTQVFGYDTGGFVNRITDANGHTSTLVNDSRGNALSRTTCRTDGTNQCYTGYRSYYLNTADPLDPRNDRVTEDRDARSASASDNTYLTRYTYTATGDIASIAAPGATTGAQRTTTNTYTAGTEPAPDGGVMPPGLLATTTDPAGGTTSYVYSNRGNLRRITDPAGLVTVRLYDGIGRLINDTVTSATVPGGAKTTFAYDGMSRLTQKVDPATSNAVTGFGHQRRTTTVYNGDGTVSSSTVDDVAGVDPARTSTYTYDSHGRVATATDPAGGVTTTGYDAFGAVTTTVDPAGTEFLSTYTTSRHQLATITVTGFTGDGQAAHDVVLESRAYDPAGRLASTTDAMGRTTGYTYYNDNQPATQVLTGYLDPTTGTTRDLLLASFTYTGTGAVASTTKGDGRYSTTVAYDPGGRATTSTDRDGSTVLRSTDITVDAVDNPIRVTQRNADGTVAADVETTVDRMGREISRATHTTSTATLVATTTRDERGLPVSTVDPRGTVAGATPAAFTTTYAYDALGQLTTVTAPPVSVESDGQPATTASPMSYTGYNTYGDTVDTRDPRGNITHATYDAAGRPTGTTLPSYTPPGATGPITASTTTAYDLAGRVTATTDGRGNTTTYGYDQLGNQRQKTDPAALFGQAGGTWLATHDPLGERLSTSDPTAARTYATYDQLGRQITSTVAERVPAPTRNLTTSVIYDPLGNPIKVTEPGGATTTATFDDLGNPLTSTNALGKTSSVSYDGAGRPVTATDPLGAKTTAGYDQAGRLTTQSDIDTGGTVLRTRGFGYDRAGNHTSATDPLGITTTQSFDAANQMTSTTRPTSATSSITSSYGYDKAGNITRRTDGNGHVTVFTVTPWNLPESTVEPATPQTPAAADRTYIVGYDRNGQTATLGKPGGVTIANTYDPQGNLTKQTGTGASVATPDRTFTYTSTGHLSGVSAPGGTNNYTYDDRGNLTSATGPSGTSAATFDSNGRRATTTTAAGTASFTYDAAGRVVSAADPLSGVTATYGYDNANRLTGIGYGTGNATRGYTYDPLGRLTGDTIKNPAGTTTASTTYGYDPNDNLTTKNTTGIAGAAANSYGYDQAGRLTSWTTGATTTDYGWDGAGNLTRDGPTTATYNERNQLTTKGSTSYTYTPRGTQASRTTGATTTNVAFNAYNELTTDGTTTNTYDGLDRLTTSGTTTLTYAGTGRTITTDGTSTYSYTPGGTPLGVKQGATATMAVTDLHTDLTALLNPTTGALAGSRSYSPFGQVTASGGTQTALGYQDQYTDPSSGNVNMGARWYQPSTGGFASRDTIGLDPRDTANANRYAYADGDPLTTTDPTGHCIPLCAIPVAWGVGEVLGWIGVGAGGAVLLDQIANGVRDWLKSNTSGAAAQAAAAGAAVYAGTNIVDEIRQLRALRGRVGNGPGGPPPGGPGGGPPPGGGPWTPPGGGISAAAAAAAAAAAEELQERLRAQRVNNDAMTPHATPGSAPTVAESLVALFNAAFNGTPIDLGILFLGASTSEQPYQPDSAGSGSAPAPLPAATGQLSGACASGGKAGTDGTRTSQTWSCGDGKPRDIVGTSHNTIRPTQDGVDPDKVERYMREMKAGAQFPPAEAIQLPDGRIFLMEGHHRYVASLRAGISLPIHIEHVTAGPIGLPDWSRVEYRIDLDQYDDDEG